MSRPILSLAPWTFGVALACSGETATEGPALTNTKAPDGGAPGMTWDGVPRDTLVRGMLADVNNMIYIVGESLSDQETIYLTNIGGFDADFDCEVKIKPHLERFREEFSPRAYHNTEWVATKTETGRRYVELFQGRLAKLAAAAAKR